MPKVTVSIPKLGVHPGGIEKNKEIYVIGLAADMRGAENREQAFIAAANETLPNIMPDIATLDAMNWVVASVSNVFERIRHDQPPSLSGSGIILYPNLNPKGMLALHLVIVESDQGKRRTGKVLKEILENQEVKGAVGSLGQALTPPLLGKLMTALVGAVPLVLQANGDDALFSHSHSGFDFDDYGLEPGTRFMDFEVGNDRAFCTLRVRLNPDS